MNARPLTDAQISQALRAHLPEAAAARPARARLRRGGDHRPAAAAALVPRCAERRGPRGPSTEPAHRGGAPGRAGSRECRGGRGVAPPPAGPCRRVEPGAAGRPPGVRPLELRAAAPAAAGRPDLARQRLDQGPHLCRSVGRGPIRSVRVRRCDGALQLQDPQPRPPHQRGGDRRVRRRSGSNRGTRRSATTRGCSSERVLSGRRRGRAARWSAIRARSATEPRQRAGDTSVSNTSRGAPRTMSRVAATSGSTSRPGSSCAPRGRRSMTLVSPSRSSPPRSPRSRSASSRQRCSNRRRASPAFRRTSTAHTSARGISRTSSCPASRTVRDCGSGGDAAARALAHSDAHRASRHERLRGSAGRPERADRSTGLDPGESEGGLARAGPPRARWRRERPTDAPHVPRSRRATTDPMLYPCVDIRWVMADTSEVHLKLVSKPAAGAWIPPSSGSRMAS